MIGKRIANYQIAAEIGSGGMGTVYRGIDSLTQQPVAIKRLKPELSTPEMLERFAREGEALRQLNHPNIVKVLATLQADGDHFLVMEYLDGGSLYDTLKATPQLPINRVLAIALELSDALARAHHVKIIHRDIKPANVLLAEDGTPRLTDFGIAFIRGKERVTETNAIVGTLDYLSPEAFQESEVDTRADIWAFGVLLFEMLAGVRPFDRATMSQTMMAILSEPPADLEALRPDAPVALVDLIYRMLEKNRDQRISSARLVGAELEAILQGRDTPSHPIRQIELAPPTPTDIAKPKHNLPAQSTPFVGREDELAEVTHLLEKSRLVTILAPGGMGKTRLSLETAERQLSHFANGVYFVELAPLNSADFIVSTIAEAVNFQFYQGGEPQRQLLDFLREKSMLLVMDNFEHVLNGATIISEILAYAPNVKIITTSRERLNLSGEALFALSGMDFPDWQTLEDALDYAAVKLFMQSARRVRPDFELQAADLKYVARICQLVDGLPLGIVLAAAWLEMLSVSEIADEITKSIDFLETEMRDIPERQRSIRAVFDYSWNLMSDDERSVFIKLSVFRGGFTREAAQAVADASLRTLMNLMNKSLIRRDANSGRYEIHQLLRQYAEGRLNENTADRDNTYDAHSSYFADFMHGLEPDVKGRRQAAALNEIEIEFENVRAAWYRAVQQKNYADLDHSMETLWLFYYMRWRHHEGEELFRQAQVHLAPTAEGEPQRTWGRILARRWSQMYWVSAAASGAGKGDIEQDLQIARQYDDQHEIAFCLLVLGYVAWVASDYQVALACFEESLTLFQQLHDNFYTVQALHRIGETHSDAGDGPVDYFNFYRQSLTLARDIGHKIETIRCLNNIGNGEIFYGQYDRGEKTCEESVTVSREVNSQFNLGHALSLFALATLVKGEFERARVAAEEGFGVSDSIQDTMSQTYAMAVLLVLASSEEDYARINELSKKIQEFHSNFVGYMLRDWGLAIANCVLGDYQPVRKLVQTLLRGAALYQADGCMTWGLPVETMVLAHEGKNERAVELLALAFTYPRSAVNWMVKWQAFTRLRIRLESELPPDVYAAAWERGKSLDLNTVVAELLAE